MVMTSKSASPSSYLVGRLDAAVLCSTSARTWDRLVCSEKTPAPVRLGGRPMWRVDELRAWIDAGCPDRRTWEAMKTSKK